MAVAVEVIDGLGAAVHLIVLQGVDEDVGGGGGVAGAGKLGIPANPLLLGALDAVATSANRQGLWWGLRPAEAVAMPVIAGLVVTASVFKWWSISPTEAWGFATGGACVWLVVREHLWNWPIGLANNVVFFVLFFQSRLYADMGLQVIYFALGVYGWVLWLNGGRTLDRLPVTRTTRTEWVVLACAVPLGTWVLREVLIVVSGAAPFWDSLTTVLSLAAQYLLCRKRLENWFLWIAADVIYVPLYLSRNLPLTALLYAVFLTMCLIGLREWRRSLRGPALPP